jgi:hypothetical protein
MQEKLDNYLVTKYSKIFINRYKGPMESCLYFGFDCNDGWFWLIDNLCNSIQSYIDNNSHKGISQVVATQVKEKFGGLSFYYSGGDDIIDGMVWLAESMSYDICEFCGSTIDIGQTKGWIYTICKECYDNSTEDRIKNLKWMEKEEKISNVSKELRKIKLDKLNIL